MTAMIDALDEDDLETILAIARNGQSGRITEREARLLVAAYRDAKAPRVTVTEGELLRCKRATVVLGEVFKVAMGGKQAPLEQLLDMQALLAVLRRLEAVAT